MGDGKVSVKGNLSTGTGGVLIKKKASGPLSSLTFSAYKCHVKTNLLLISSPLGFRQCIYLKFSMFLNFKYLY
jgi:hypothetical protein